MRRRRHDRVSKRGVRIRTHRIQRNVAGHVFRRHRKLIVSSRRIVSVNTGLDRVLNDVRHVCEEVITGQCFNRVDSCQVSMPVAVDAVVVRHDHRDHPR